MSKDSESIYTETIFFPNELSSYEVKLILLCLLQHLNLSVKRTTDRQNGKIMYYFEDRSQ